MSAKLKIDFVSDVSCPWCIIGLRSLETALAGLAGEVEAELHFQPFELNPQMPYEGQDINEHLKQKYGASKEQAAQTRDMIKARAAEVGFTMNLETRDRIYNTFDAHRLLHWAEQEGRQHELKVALFTAYFTEGKNPGDHAVLRAAAEAVGLDGARAAAVLESDAFAEDVRRAEAFYHQAGINSVPSIIINDRHLIQGGQPAEVFARALRQIAGETANA